MLFPKYCKHEGIKYKIILVKKSKLKKYPIINKKKTSGIEVFFRNLS